MKPLTPATPHVIIMVGIPGAGKTAFAEHFAKMFHAPFINTRGLSALMSTDAETAQKAAEHFLSESLKTNRTLIYEGPTHTKVHRTAIAKQVSEAGYKPLLVWVQTESTEALRRSTRRTKLGGVMDESEFNDSLKRFTPPGAAEKPVVISGKHTYTTQLKVVLRHLAGQSRPEPNAEQEPPRQRSGRQIILR